MLNPTGPALEIADPNSPSQELSTHIWFTPGRVDIEVVMQVDNFRHTHRHTTRYPKNNPPLLIQLSLFSIMDVDNLFFRGELIHIVGTSIGDHGSQCSMHTITLMIG